MKQPIFRIRMQPTSKSEQELLFILRSEDPTQWFFVFVLRFLHATSEESFLENFMSFYFLLLGMAGLSHLKISCIQAGTSSMKIRH